MPTITVLVVLVIIFIILEGTLAIKKIAIISALLSGVLLASENELVTHSEFSYINTKGNTNTDSLAFESKVAKSIDEHKFRAFLEAYRSSDEGKTSKEKWATELNYDYSFSEKLAFNYMLGYKRDRFSGFDYQFYTGPGLVYKAIDAEKQKLNIQGNILYALDKPEDGKQDRYLSAKAGFDYSYQILDNLKFVQDASYRSNLKDTKKYFIYSKTGIENKINDIFSLGLSYKIDYAAVPPADSKRMDRTFLASLIIDY